MHEWDRRENETDPAWVAFQTYRDMRHPRSIRDVAEALGKSASLIARWSSAHDWPNRVRAFERWMDQQTVGAWADQLRALVEESTSLARAFVAKTTMRLAAVPDAAQIPADVIQSVSVVVRAQQHAIMYLRPERPGDGDDTEPTVDVGALARELYAHGHRNDR